MLKTIQIIALLQGFFLIFILFKHKKNYNNVNFWLLLSCIISVLLFSIGDDDYNLFFPNTNWFIFHDTLIITFFFLFVKYYKSNCIKFHNSDYLYFIPYIISISLETSIQIGWGEKNTFFWILKNLTELTFISYLIYTIYDIIKTKKDKWLLYFITILTVIFIVDELYFFVTKTHNSPFFLDSYGIILIAIFLFYYILYKLIISPKDVLPKASILKYKTSSLHIKNVEKYKVELIKLMDDEKLFKKNKLTVNDVAKRLNIPRQHLSEVLNIHMKINFQDFLNQYRVEEFIKCLNQKKYKKYTLLAIANEVGFNSKSSFNTCFKKIKGVTPSQYKKQNIIE